MEHHGSCVCNLGNCKKSLKKYRFGWDIHVNPMGEQGWRSGESTRLPPVWLGFNSRSRCHNLCGLSLLLVLVLAPRVFSGYSGFPPSVKTNISKFEFDLDVS